MSHYHNTHSHTSDRIELGSINFETKLYTYASRGGFLETGQFSAIASEAQPGF